MRITWGARGETVTLGREVAPCASCRRPQPLLRLLRYRVSYFGDPALCWVSQRRYTSVCEACGGEADGAAPDAASGSAADPIPWKDRYGFLAGSAGSLVLLLFFSRLIRYLSEVPGR
jgi:hypothetical protein